LKWRFQIHLALAAQTPRSFFGGGREQDFCPRTRRGFTRGLGCGSFARRFGKKSADSNVQTLARPGWEKPLLVRAVPPPVSRPAFFAHPRLRRANAISQFTVAAALEALGENASARAKRRGAAGHRRLRDGRQRELFAPVLRGSFARPGDGQPADFSGNRFQRAGQPPRRVSRLETAGYTLVGDDGTFLQGLALAAQWLVDDKMDACIVIGAEETDWIVADAMKLFPATLFTARARARFY
jgi:hypothetical protein